MKLVSIVGWSWIGFMSLTGIYGLVTSSSLEKGLILIAVAVVLASPGFILVTWSRRSPT